MIFPAPNRFLLGLLCCLCILAEPTRTQQTPADAAEISRDLLYHPARRIEFAEGSVVFRAEQFTYRFTQASGEWGVQREHNFRPSDLPRSVQTWKQEPGGALSRFSSPDDDNNGVLEIRQGAEAESEPVARLTLWTRRQLADRWLDRLQKENPDLTAEKLAAELDVSEPEVAAVAKQGAVLWLAIRYYAGEGMLGLGTLVRFDPQTREARVYQPEELSHSSITQIVAAGGFLWLGTMREGEGTTEPTAGLVRFDPATGVVRKVDGVRGKIVTALAAAAGFLWAATDEGICRAENPGEAAEHWTCWRIVPIVQLSAPTPASNRPGGPPPGRLAAGSYEVRWANAAFLEVVTPDAVEGWVEEADLKDYEQRQFDAPAYELGNAYGGGAGVMRLLAKPAGDPLAAAQVYRTPLERAGEASEGWQHVRARVGWIRREKLEIVPLIQPAAR